MTYLRATSIEMATAGYTRDCVHHAVTLAELLRAAGEQPWIGRLRDVRLHGDSTFHAPLTPRRFPAHTWTTHYVCCLGSDVYDPIAGEPANVESYAREVFGRPLPVTEFLAPVETAKLLGEGRLREAFRTTHLSPVKR